MKVFRKLRGTAAIVLSVLVIAVICAGVTPKASAAEATSQAGQVTASGNLNVRSAASTAGAILTKLPSGSYVTLMWKTGNWWYVEYAASTYGYVSADYIRTVAGAYAVKVSSAAYMLNVRSGPGTSYGITGVLKSGQTALALSSGGGWLRILYNGTQTGYASARYLTSPVVWPVPASQKINQYYGASHQGLDIGASVRGVPGDKVVAALDGRVVYAGVLSGYGYVVYMNSVYSGQPVQLRYAHLNSAPSVAVGDEVAAGQLIGYMGSTGTSSGVHLHFEFRIRNSAADCLANGDSTPVNPLTYVS